MDGTPREETQQRRRRRNTDLAALQTRNSAYRTGRPSTWEHTVPSATKAYCRNREDKDADHTAWVCDLSTRRRSPKVHSTSQDRDGDTIMKDIDNSSISTSAECTAPSSNPLATLAPPHKTNKQRIQEYRDSVEALFGSTTDKNQAKVKFDALPPLNTSLPLASIKPRPPVQEEPHSRRPCGPTSPPSAATFAAYNARRDAEEALAVPKMPSIPIIRRTTPPRKLNRRDSLALRPRSKATTLQRPPTRRTTHCPLEAARPSDHAVPPSECSALKTSQASFTDEPGLREENMEGETRWVYTTHEELYAPPSPIRRPAKPAAALVQEGGLEDVPLGLEGGEDGEWTRIERDDEEEWDVIERVGP